MHCLHRNLTIRGPNDIFEPVGVRPHLTQGVSHGEAALGNANQLRKLAVAKSDAVPETFQINGFSAHAPTMCPDWTLVNRNSQNYVATSEIDRVSDEGTLMLMNNRIRELREARGWSMRKLADQLNTTGSTINKLEKGRMALTVDWLHRIAKVLDTKPSEIISEDKINKSRAFKDDASPYQTQEGTSVPDIKLSDSQFLWEAKSNSLDQIGIVPGVLLVVDISSEEISKLQSEDVVICQLYDDMSATTLMRQYIHPSLLITNSSSENAPTLNLRTDDVAIKGIVISSHAKMRGKHQMR